MATSRRLVGGAAAIALCGSSPAAAATPSDLNDLIGVRGSSAEGEMETRGYHQISTSPSDDGVYSYWWHGSRKQCVRVLTSHGRYQRIATTGSSDCGKKSSSSDNAAAVAIGAAAILGVAVLASKSHHRDDKEYDAQGTADFERGYRDGLYNEAYHNYSRNDAYSNGYSAGVSERGHQTSYRDRYAYRGGYGGYSGYNDVVGRSNSQADDMLRGRGFVYVGKDASGGGAGHERTYWHAANQQCISVRTSSGSVSEAYSVPKRTCR